MEVVRKLNVLGFESSYHKKEEHSVLQEMIKEIEESFSECSTQILSMCKIEYCRGCKNCFINCKCPIEDDVPKIIQCINESKIIVFYTSIYADFVNGYTKNLLDRLSFMTHTMPFIGKYCIIILSTYKSGIDESLRYLYRYFSLLGFNVIGILSVTSQDDNREVSKRISYIVRRIEREIYRDLRNESLIQKQMRLKLFSVYGNEFKNHDLLED